MFAWEGAYSLARACHHPVCVDLRLTLVTMQGVMDYSLLVGVHNRKFRIDGPLVPAVPPIGQSAATTGADVQLPRGAAAGSASPAAVRTSSSAAAAELPPQAQRFGRGSVYVLPRQSVAPPLLARTGLASAGTANMSSAQQGNGSAPARLNALRAATPQLRTGLERIVELPDVPSPTISPLLRGRTGGSQAAASATFQVGNPFHGAAATSAASGAGKMPRISLLSALDEADSGSSSDQPSQSAIGAAAIAATAVAGESTGSGSGSGSASGRIPPADTDRAEDDDGLSATSAGGTLRPALPQQARVPPHLRPQPGKQKVLAPRVPPLLALPVAGEPVGQPPLPQPLPAGNGWARSNAGVLPGAHPRPLAGAQADTDFDRDDEDDANSRHQAGAYAHARLSDVSDNPDAADHVPFFRADEGGLAANIIEGPGVFYMGIIDILQEWSLIKRAERVLKRYFMCLDARGLSVMAPEEYAARFERRVITAIIEQNAPVAAGAPGPLASHRDR